MRLLASGRSRTCPHFNRIASLLPCYRLFTFSPRFSNRKRLIPVSWPPRFVTPSRLDYAHPTVRFAHDKEEKSLVGLFFFLVITKGRENGRFRFGVFFGWLVRVTSIVCTDGRRLVTGDWWRPDPFSKLMCELVSGWCGRLVVR